MVYHNLVRLISSIFWLREAAGCTSMRRVEPQEASGAYEPDVIGKHGTDTDSPGDAEAMFFAITPRAETITRSALWM
jgi:hypothetical protein